MVLPNGCMLSQGHFLFLGRLASAVTAAIDNQMPVSLNRARASSSTSSTVGFWYGAMWGFVFLAYYGVVPQCFRTDGRTDVYTVDPLCGG